MGSPAQSRLGSIRNPGSGYELYLDRRVGDGSIISVQHDDVPQPERAVPERPVGFVLWPGHERSSVGHECVLLVGRVYTGGLGSRNTSADGRIIVGAGTTFSVTFNENAQSGGSWSHDHVGDDHTHTITGNTSASTATSVGATGGGLNLDPLGHTHPLTATAAANHATTGAYAWAYPAYSLVMAYKT
jgi:hypothetical protein